MDYVKKLLWGIVQTLSVFCFMAALIVYDYVKDTPWILGYVYAKTSLIFAGIENKELWQIQDTSSYCGITKEGQYVIVVMDKIFIGAGAKDVCLDESY
jgi:hypothetical protein